LRLMALSLGIIRYTPTNSMSRMNELAATNNRNSVQLAWSYGHAYPAAVHASAAEGR
jgi:hypothetical protein